MADPTTDFMGLIPTGREMKDPAATLIELEDDEERIYTAIRFQERYRGHDAVTLNVELVQSFMEHPMVVGLVELARHDLQTATFAYPTGRVFTLMDVLRTYRDIGQAPGPRAALEMAYLAGQILHEAGETGPMQGCFSHGNLNPCRIAVRLDGQLQVFGYGLAQVDLLAHMKDPATYPVHAESLRYAPPERVEGQPEGPSSDTYSLIAIAYEMIAGRPLYDTLDIDQMKEMIALSEGTTILSRSGHGLPEPIARTFARALIYDPDTRLSGEELLDELDVLMQRQDLQGDGLAVIMEKMRGQQVPRATRGKKLVSTAGTGMFTPQQLKELAEEEEEEDDAAPDQRWGRVSRDRRRRTEDANEPAPSEGRRRRRREHEEEDEPASPRRRLRRRGAAEPEAEAAQPDEAPEEDEEPASPRRRLRRRAAAEPEADATQPDEAAEGEDEPASPRRRLRRRAAAEADEAPEEDEEPASPRRRLRRRAAAEPEAEADEAPEEDEEPASPRRRLRRRGAAEPEAEAAQPAEAPEEDEEPASPRRRLRRRAPAEPEGEADEAPEEEEPASPRRRLRRRSEGSGAAASPRRRRRSGSEDEAEEEPRRRRRRRTPSGNDP